MTLDLHACGKTACREGTGGRFKRSMNLLSTKETWTLLTKTNLKPHRVFRVFQTMPCATDLIFPDQHGYIYSYWTGLMWNGTDLFLFKLFSLFFGTDVSALLSSFLDKNGSAFVETAFASFSTDGWLSLTYFHPSKSSKWRRNRTVTIWNRSSECRFLPPYGTRQRHAGGAMKRWQGQ
jgi:hypothetical protein